MRRVVGVNFDHMHMGDLLREVREHPGAEVVAVADRDMGRMRPVLGRLGLPETLATTDVAAALASRPDMVILCPATADHARAVEEVAPLAPGATILMEKPFAASLADADRMIAAARAHGCALAVNWPLAWYPTHNQAKRLLDEGVIGELLEVHFHDGNRGPLFHLADKVEVTPEEVERQKPDSWWYKAASGGGSLLDYLGYGATLGTWFMGGEGPEEVTATTWGAPGLEVDEHAIVALRYARGLSCMETRWGTFTDPWTTQPQPRCGFVLVGSEGTVSSWDYDDHVTVQTRARPEAHPVPAPPLEAPRRRPVEYLLHAMDTGEPIRGPLDLSIARMGQRIVDTAFQSAQEKRTLKLIG